MPAMCQQSFGSKSGTTYQHANYWDERDDLKDAPADEKEST